MLHRVCRGWWVRTGGRAVYYIIQRYVDENRAVSKRREEGNVSASIVRFPCFQIPIMPIAVVQGNVRCHNV